MRAIIPSVNLSKIPKHIWWGVVLPLVLVGLGVWRLWPMIEEYREADEREAVAQLNVVTMWGGLPWPSNTNDFIFAAYNRDQYVLVTMKSAKPPNVEDLIPDFPPDRGYYILGFHHPVAEDNLTFYCA